MTIKERIKALCVERDLNLPKLEEALGFGNSTISKWDKSSPSLDKVIKVADFFDVSVDFLAGRETKKLAADDDNELLRLSVELVKRIPPEKLSEVENFIQYLISQADK